MKTVYALRCFFLSLVLFATAPAHALTTLGFDDAVFPRGPVFNSAHPAGVTFTVTPLEFNSSDYGADAFAGLAFVDGQVLDIGAAHILDLTFATPVSFLEFGVAHNLPSSFGDFLSVTLFTQDGTLDGSFEIPPFGGAPAETLYSYTAGSAGSALIGLSILFPGEFTSDTDRFQIDNLTFQPVPEPSTYAMLIAGLLLLGSTRLRGRQGSGR